MGDQILKMNKYVKKKDLCINETFNYLNLQLDSFLNLIIIPIYYHFLE